MSEGHIEISRERLIDTGGILQYMSIMYHRVAGTGQTLTCRKHQTCKHPAINLHIEDAGIC